MESANSLGLLIVLVLVYLGTLCGGTDSRDGLDGVEWERQRYRRGFGGVKGRPG